MYLLFQQFEAQNDLIFILNNIHYVILIHVATA